MRMHLLLSLRYSRSLGGEWLLELLPLLLLLRGMLRFLALAAADLNERRGGCYFQWDRCWWPFKLLVLVRDRSIAGYLGFVG